MTKALPLRGAAACTGREHLVRRTVVGTPLTHLQPRPRPNHQPGRKLLGPTPSTSCRVGTSTRAQQHSEHDRTAQQATHPTRVFGATGGRAASNRTQQLWAVLWMCVLSWVGHESKHTPQQLHRGAADISLLLVGRRQGFPHSSWPQSQVAVLTFTTHPGRCSCVCVTSTPSVKPRHVPFPLLGPRNQHRRGLARRRADGWTRTDAC